MSRADEGLALHLHQSNGLTLNTSTKRYLPETAPEQIEGSAVEFARLMGWFRTFLLVLIAVYALPLFWLVGHVARSNLHSHVLLIPFVCIYLLHIHRHQLPSRYVAAPAWTVLLGGAGVLSLAGAWLAHGSGEWMSYNDDLALFAFSLVCLVLAGAFFFLGGAWMKAAAFPMAFLIFMVPLPDGVADFLENASKLGSAEVANMLFALTGTPVLREGTIFMLPGISVEVAKECSGIRSSYVLFITSLLAAYLFLRSPMRRFALVAAIIPLGLLRNGFRILTISLLCVHIGPHMINSPIHRHGGPVFFVASLIPLFVLLWWLRRGEEDAGTNKRAVITDKAPAGESCSAP